uniref:Endonuclease/exonuclease/phosphatase domain-containing protein n=1 Tax=Sparus aurata TaxID=8175 RepID=A0A671UU51_SPAAU
MCVTKVTSLNVKGINNVVKRRKILSSLKKEGAHIAFLQETHLSDFEHVKLRRDWVGQVFYSSFNSKSRGVAILLHKKLPFTLDKCFKDSEGRHASFYSKLLAVLSSNTSPLIILGGDLNALILPLIYEPFICMKWIKK